MKNVMLLLTFLLGLAACAPASETPVSSITPTIESALPATITVEPTASPTETSTVDVANILHDTCYYGQEEIDSFVDISTKTIEINGEPLNVIVGVDAQGQETILAGEKSTYDQETVWTRISVTELGGNNGQMVVWLNPDQDGSIQVNEKTAEMFRDRFFEVVRDGGQGAAIDSMTDGELTIEAPQAHSESGGSDVDWVAKTFDLHDVEIRMFQSQEEWQEFAHNYPDIAAKVFSSRYGRSGGGVYLHPKDDGGSLIIVLDSGWSSMMNPFWDGTENIQQWGVEATRQSLEGDVFYFSFWEPLSIFAYRNFGKDALMKAINLGRTEYPLVGVVGSFDFIPDGFVENNNLNLTP